jgi:hypothetical protein
MLFMLLVLLLGKLDVTAGMVIWNVIYMYDYIMY